MKKLFVYFLLSCISFSGTSNASDSYAKPLHSDSDSMALLQKVKDRSIVYLLGLPGNGAFRQKAVKENDKWIERIIVNKFTPLVWDETAALTMNVKINEYAGELRRMAIVFRTKGSKYEQNPELKRRIIAGLENVLKYYNPKTPRPGNWYQWLISLPNNIGSTALLMESFLPADLLNRLRAELRYELSPRLVLTGTNAAWESRNHIYLALLDKDINRLKRAADYVFRTVRYGTESGVREDYCYLFHGRIPYAGGYGAGFVQTIAEFIYVFDGTPFAISPVHREIIINLVLEHTRWFLVAGETDLHVRGRTLKKEGNWNLILESLIVLAQINDPRQNDLTQTTMAMLKTSLEENLNLTGAGFADAIKKVDAELPGGFRYWPTGEIGVYKQPDFHIGFRQFSNRVQDYEYLKREDGGEGEDGWNLPYGFTNIVREDGTGSWYNKGGMLPDIDMEHLTGTTSRIGGNPVNPPFSIDPAHPDYKATTGFSLNFGKSEFAGGAGWEDGGVAGFILQPAYGEFIAKKSLHFFPEGYWALGSGISSTTKAGELKGKPIHTTLLQWACSKSDPVLVLPERTMVLSGGLDSSIENAKWFWIKDENIAVVFYEPANIKVRLTNNIISAWIDHGSQPSSDRYAYAVLPSISLDQTKRFAQDMPFKPVRYDDNVHAVKEVKGSSESIVFFAPDSCFGIKSQAPAIVYRKGSGDGGVYSIQDPFHKNGKIKLTVDKIPGLISLPDKNVNIERSASGTANIEVSSALGRIYRFGYGDKGKTAKSMIWKDLPESSDKFNVEAKSDAQNTILTVHLPDEAIRDGYLLSVHHAKSQRYHDFTEADIIDRPSPNIVRFRWNRTNANGPVVFADYWKVKDGQYKVYLVTKLIEESDSFTVPKFDK